MCEREWVVYWCTIIDACPQEAEGPRTELVYAVEYSAQSVKLSLRLRVCCCRLSAETARELQHGRHDSRYNTCRRDSHAYRGGWGRLDAPDDAVAEWLRGLVKHLKQTGGHSHELWTVPPPKGGANHQRRDLIVEYGSAWGLALTSTGRVCLSWSSEFDGCAI